MRPTLHKGDRVHNDDFGAGEVVAVYGDAALVALTDLGGLELQIALEDLRLLTEGAERSPQPVVISATPPDDHADDLPTNDVLAMRRVIEALRFGLVPQSGLESITVGFDSLATWIGGRLDLADKGTPTLSEVSGAFGTGKSHTMAVVRMLAEQRGYVTAHVEIDGRIISLADPERLLERLWGTLRVDGVRSSTPLLDLYVGVRGPVPKMCKYGIDRVRDNYRMVRLAERNGCLDKYAHSLDAVISSSRELPASELSQQLAREPNIAAHEVSVRRMIGHRVDDRPDDFVRALAGHALIARAAGYRGLLVTLDEFEIEALGGHTDRVIRSIAALANYLAGEAECPEAPLAIFVASVGQDGHLGDRLLDIIMERAGGERHSLEPLCTPDRHTLVETVQRLYETAYGITDSVSPSLATRLRDEAESADDIESGLVRTLIKRCVAFCDAEYGPPTHGRVA